GAGDHARPSMPRVEVRTADPIVRVTPARTVVVLDPQHVVVVGRVRGAGHAEEGPGDRGAGRRVHELALEAADVLDVHGPRALGVLGVGREEVAPDAGP